MADRGPLTTPRGPSHCASCRRPLTARAFVSTGYLGVYVECEYCFTGTPRPVEPELITDTFTRAQPTQPAPGSLDAILDKLTGEPA